MIHILSLLAGVIVILLVVGFAILINERPDIFVYGAVIVVSLIMAYAIGNNVLNFLFDI